MWVWILFCVRFIAIVKATIDILPQILKINSNKLTLKLWTHCEPTSITKIVSLTNCSVHSHLNHLFSVSTFLYFTLAMCLLSHSIYTGRDKALQIIWTLCQYIINRTSQQFTVGGLSRRAGRIQCEHHWLALLYFVASGVDTMQVNVAFWCCVWMFMPCYFKLARAKHFSLWPAGRLLRNPGIK